MFQSIRRSRQHDLVISIESVFAFIITITSSNQLLHFRLLNRLFRHGELLAVRTSYILGVGLFRSDAISDIVDINPAIVLLLLLYMSFSCHYSGVTMSAMASQITGVLIVHSTVCSGASKTSKLRVTGLCEWNAPMTGEFPAQSASNA